MANENQPSISLNKLGEYIFVSDAKKRSILKTLKFPSTFITSRYSSPKSAVIQFMLDEKHEIRILQLKRNTIERRKASTEWQKNNQQCCLQAMDDLIICSNTVLLPYLKFRAQRGLPKDQKRKIIDGVIVHVNPDIVLLGKDGLTIVGAICLVFSKSRPISGGEGQVIAGLIRNHIERTYKTVLKEINCVAFDVFHRRCITAEKDFQTTDLKIKKACAEIKVLWPTINK